MSEHTAFSGAHPAGNPSAESGPDADHLTVLRVRLQELYQHAGEPSYRQLANRTGAMSQTTAHAIIQCKRSPRRWGNLELIVEALNGNVREFHALWLGAETAGNQPAAAELSSLQASPSAARAALTGHNGAVRAVAWNLDGRLLASASDDWTVRVWDAATGLPTIDPLTEHRSVVMDVGWSPDGRLLASGSADGTVRVWDAVTGLPAIDPLTGHDGPVWGVAWSPEGRLASAGSRDRTIRVWGILDRRSSLLTEDYLARLRQALLELRLTHAQVCRERDQHLRGRAKERVALLEEGGRILEEAESRAEEIITKAREKAEELLAAARREQRRNQPKRPEFPVELRGYDHEQVVEALDAAEGQPELFLAWDPPERIGDHVDRVLRGHDRAAVQAYVRQWHDFLGRRSTDQ